MTPQADSLSSLTIAAGGWVRAQVGRNEPFFVRFALSDAGRLVPVELYLSGSPLSPTLLRTLPLARVESLVNAPDARQRLIAALKEAGPNPRGRLERYTFATAMAIELLEQDAAIPPLAELEKRWPWLDERAPKHDRDAGYEQWLQRHYTLPPVLPAVPEGKKPDYFYRRVGEVYATVAGHTSRPAPEIAEASGVPVSTVHRWVKEARRRGFLGPGQKGRRG